MRKICALGMACMTFVASSSSMAQEDSGPVFNPELACGDILPVTQTIDKVMVGIWAAGYIAGKSGTVSPMGAASNERLLDRLNLACAQSPGTSLVDIVVGTMEMADALKDMNNSDFTPGSPEDGRRFIEQFMSPDVDKAALTETLFPTPEEVRMVFAEPVASRLIQWYDEIMYPGNIAIEPKPEQTQIISFFTTINDLKEFPSVRDEFPGGYEGILDYFKTDAPIGAFKFVREGLSYGTSISGLIFINDHWVIMPKPWRGLEEN